jgi:sulfur relay (sulfurtransferase) DsrF/TusC family protein
MKVLQVVESAYRATIEEQDDTVLWFTQVLRNSGAATAVLLRGPAVSYVVSAQDASGVKFGSWRQAQPPRISAAVLALIASGVNVYVDADDLEERGIGNDECVAGCTPVRSTQLAELFEGFDRVWQW